jgi:hypothetical protein
MVREKVAQDIAEKGRCRLWPHHHGLLTSSTYTKNWPLLGILCLVRLDSRSVYLLQYQGSANLGAHGISYHSLVWIGEKRVNNHLNSA